MAYSNTWDETAPADTSLANLLGQDIRTFKTDIRQRIASFTAGAQNNAPYPESVWAGVLYFATDTHKVLQYAGTGWNDITSGFPTGPQGPPGNQGPQGPPGTYGGIGFSNWMSSGLAGNGAAQQLIISGPMLASRPAGGFTVWCGFEIAGASVAFGGWTFVCNGVNLWESGPIAATTMPMYVTCHFMFFDMNAGSNVQIIGQPSMGNDGTNGSQPKFFGYGTPNARPACDIVHGSNIIGIAVNSMPPSMNIMAEMVIIAI